VATNARIQSGSDLLKSVRENFAAMQGLIEEVAEAVGGIVPITSQQAEGIEQINTAVIEQEKAVQQTSQESEEMDHLVQDVHKEITALNSMVIEFQTLLGGDAKGSAPGAPPIETRKRAAGARSRGRLPLSRASRESMPLIFRRARQRPMQGRPGSEVAPFPGTPQTCSRP